MAAAVSPVALAIPLPAIAGGGEAFIGVTGGATGRVSLALTSRIFNTRISIPADDAESFALRILAAVEAARR